MPFHLRVTSSTRTGQRLLDELKLPMTFDSEERMKDVAASLEACFKVLAFQLPGTTRTVNLVETQNDTAPFQPYPQTEASCSTPPRLSSGSDTTAMDMSVVKTCPRSKTEKTKKVEEPASPIYSIGFEFQSSDLFLLVIEYETGLARFQGRYATALDIPENAPVELHRVKTATVSVQLDAVPPEQDEIRHYLNTLPKHQINLGEAGNLAFLESEEPQDTEFVILDTNRDSVLFFEPDKARPDPVELLLTHYEAHKVFLCSWKLERDAWLTHEFTTRDSDVSPWKYSFLRIMSPLKRSEGRSFGYISHGFRSEDARHFSFVPQVTFGCDLLMSHSIVAQLAERTSANKYLGTLKRALEYATALCGPEHTCVRSFVFLLAYYLNILGEHSKQELGLALRHSFTAVFGGLKTSDQLQVRSVTGNQAERLIGFAAALEHGDGVHRYTYPGGGVILLEYRLFNYLVEPEGMTIVEPLPRHL